MEGILLKLITINKKTRSSVNGESNTTVSFDSLLPLLIMAPIISIYDNQSENNTRRGKYKINK